MCPETMEDEGHDLEQLSPNVGASVLREVQLTCVRLIVV